jgi:hypothetical protein
MQTVQHHRMWKSKKQWVHGSSVDSAVAVETLDFYEAITHGLVQYVLWPLLRLIAALAAAFAVTGAMTLTAAAQASRAAVVCDGPSPTAQSSANMPQARLSVYYNTVFLQFLYQTLNKLLMCTHMDMPEKRGQTWRNFMSVPLPADLTQQTEGTVGSPEQISTNFNDIVMGQYANYTNVSDFAMLTSISQDMENFRMILAYQFGLTVDDIINNMMDYLITLDSRTANQNSTVAPYSFTKNIIEQMPGSLSTAFVPPMKSGAYTGSILPAFCSDMAIDNSNNSVVDIWKHTEAGQLKLEQLVDKDEGMAPAQIFSLFGCHWRPSTNQPQIANWQGSGLTAFYTYLAGMDAMIFINFPNKRHTSINEQWKNMDLWSGEYQRSGYDANGVIMGGTGYNGILGIGPPPDTTSRMRIAGAVPQTT